MFIANVDKKELFKCGEIVHKYLYDKIPLLSRDNNYYYYSKTERLEQLLEDAPFWIKAVIKWSR